LFSSGHDSATPQLRALLEESSSFPPLNTIRIKKILFEGDDVFYKGFCICTVWELFRYWLKP
jgi:hypothetical protein